MTPTWQRVNQLEPGQVYQQGNVAGFINMTGWKGAQVLYFGDHVFGDLAVRSSLSPSLSFTSLLLAQEPQLSHGWKTGAILPELEVSPQGLGPA